jgi:hypothetical protein
MPAMACKTSAVPSVQSKLEQPRIVADRLHRPRSMTIYAQNSSAACWS